MKKFFKKYWFVIIGILIISYFFFPKDCGYWDVLKEKNCKCYGIIRENYPKGPSEGWDKSCYGICMSDCECREGIHSENRTVVSCD